MSTVKNIDSPGSRLREFAETAYKSISAFSRALGYAHPGVLYQYFNGSVQVGINVLNRCQELGCSIHWLLTGEGGMFADNAAGEALRLQIEPNAQPKKKKQPMAAFCTLFADRQKNIIVAVRSGAEFDDKERFQKLCFIHSEFLHPKVLSVIESGIAAEIGALQLLVTLE